MPRLVLGALEGRWRFRRLSFCSQITCSIYQETWLKQINYRQNMCKCRITCNQTIGAIADPQEKRVLGECKLLLLCQERPFFFDFHRHLWVSHSLTCEKLHQHLPIWASSLCHSSSIFSAIHPEYPMQLKLLAQPLLTTCRLRRTTGYCSLGFPRWDARCSSQSLPQPAGFLLSASGPVVSGWMPTMLVHLPEANKWDQGFRIPQGELRMPVTGTHHCLWLIHQGKVREIYE